MGTRLDLQARLEELLGTSEVYFQPPANLVMRYPAIVYERDNAVSEFADNSVYAHTKRYQVTVIERDPDSTVPDKVGHLPLSAFVRHFVADQLYHDIYSVYF